MWAVFAKVNGKWRFEGFANMLKASTMRIKIEEENGKGSFIRFPMPEGEVEGEGGQDR